MHWHQADYSTCIPLGKVTWQGQDFEILYFTVSPPSERWEKTPVIELFPR